MLPFSPPRIDQKIIDEVVDTLQSGWWTTGPKTKLFEKKISEYCGNPNTLCVSSATAGMELMLKWFGVKVGDEVIVPAYTYCATANVVIHCGAKPVMVDVGTDFNISVERIREKITSRTKVIMPVDIGGLPCNYKELLALVNEQNVKSKFEGGTQVQEELGRILVLSDSAHSIGGRYNGKMCGSLTDISVFSFHAVKNLATAEGGAIALNLPKPFNNEEIYKKLCVASLHGQSKDAYAKTKVGGWRYDVVEAGYKCNMTDIQASIGLVELARYEQDMLVKRKQIFAAYCDGLSSYDWAEIPKAVCEDRVSSYHVFMLRIKGISESQRDEIVDEIFKREVSVNVHFQPLPMLSYYKNLGYNISDYPVAYDNFSREITLPLYYDLSQEQVETVVNAVVASVESVVA